MAIRRENRERISDATYLELVGSLFETLPATIIMTALFIVTAWACVGEEASRLLRTLAAAGSTIAIARVVIVVFLRARIARRGLDVSLAQRSERLFGGVYLAFAITIGLFAAVCISECPFENQMVTAALLVGYGAGVTAAISLRPWICIPALVVSAAPIMATSVALGDKAHLLLALVFSALMAGGFVSVAGRYRAAIGMIEMRQRFALLARRDPLTGLANRLALEDGFLAAVEECGGEKLVLHCFDLDRFKPVNDIHGHVIGDLLLQAVAQRMTGLLRPGDFAVRLGGDEFAVLQTHVEHADQAELMARRIARAIADPYTIEGHVIRIGTSVGWAGGRDHGPDLARLLSFADKALYEMKNSRRPERALAV